MVEKAVQKLMGLGKKQTADFCEEGVLIRAGAESGESRRLQPAGGACGIPGARGFVEGTWAKASV